MFWKINYCKVGDNRKFYKVVNLQLETQKQVVNWFYCQQTINISYFDEDNYWKQNKNYCWLDHHKKYCKSLYRYNFRVLGVVNMSSNGYKRFHSLGFKNSNFE